MELQYKLDQLLKRVEKPGRYIGGEVHAAVKEPSQVDADFAFAFPDIYEIDFMELSNGQKIDSRIYPYLQEMFDDARNAGVYPFVREGYRTAEEQQQILDDKIAAYRSEGYTKHMAEETAMEWVALPGTSEHQLGIAVDINADTSKCSRDDVYNWLLENSYKYGFIQRYPSGKTSITGVANEPWHYRYVGKDAAEAIHQSGMCLEEYIDTLD